MKKYLLLLISTSYFLFPAVAHADWFLDRSGNLIQIDGAILGDNTPDEVEDKQEVENEEPRPETLKKQIPNPRSSNLEIRREEDKTKLRQEIKDKAGKVINRKEVEMKAGEALHIEQVDGAVINVEARRDGHLEMVKNRIRTSSNLQLNVDEKNEISVTQPNGKTKEISLPDKALARLIASGIIAPPSEGEESQYELIAGKNGDPAYEVEGIVEKKFLGLFKLNFSQKMEVAATDSDDGTVQSGDVVEAESLETSPWRRFLERLSR